MPEFEPNLKLDQSLIGLLHNIETVYEQLLDVSAKSHKSQRFSIAIFGSARLKEQSPEFQFVSKLTKRLLETIDVDIVTGGGPGIMEAANQGLTQACYPLDKRAKNYGLLIQLPFEEDANPYVHIEKKHKHFTTRLQSFVGLIQGAYISVGGIGTLLELALLLQLKQAGHLPANFPIIVDSVLWKPLLEQLYDLTYTQRIDSPLINDGDIQSIIFSNDIDEIVEIFNSTYTLWKTK
jgi:predicted Rossmann-fold nucleotide-binding protein